MNKFFSVAVDGPSGAGKSSLSRRCAREFGFIYVDTGAIYRCVGLAAHRSEMDMTDEKTLCTLLPRLDIKMSYDAQGVQRMYLDGKDVSDIIRTPEISRCASVVSAMQGVRSFLLEMQRKIARENNVIMDGRDIGTVVLPDAQLKIFLTASPEARAERRLLELHEKGLDISFDEVLSDINERDRRDTERAAAPLKAAEDSVLVDTSELDFEESFQTLCRVIRSRYKPEENK